MVTLPTPSVTDGPAWATMVNSAILEVEAQLLGAYMPAVGNFIGTSLPGTNGATAFRVHTSSGNRVPAPILIRMAVTVDQIAMEVGTAEAGKNVKALVYNSGANGFPATKIIDQNLSLATLSNVIVTLPTPVVLPAGIYWGFFLSDATTGTAMTYNATGFMGGFGTFNQVRVNAQSGGPAFDVGTFAAPLATPVPGNNSNWGGNNNPVIGLRRSA